MHHEMTRQPKAELTEIRRAGELVVIPESPLEITRRVTLFPKLVEALEMMHEPMHPVNLGRECRVCELLR